MEDRKLNRKKNKRSDVKCHKCCIGALYYSQSLMDRNQPPICGGIRQDYKSAENIQELQTETANLSGFKYVCVGYSIYDDDRMRRQPDREGPINGVIDLPYCEGVEIISSKQLQQGPVLLNEGDQGGTTTQDSSLSSSNNARQRKTKSTNIFNSDATNFISEPGNVDWENFPSKFLKSSKMILKRMEYNANHTVQMIKQLFDKFN